MSYELALGKAGADVHKFKSFGSYQGDWLAEVTYNCGHGYVRGYYGSCSGCDAFQAEVEGLSHSSGDGYHSIGWGDTDPNCEQCKEAEAKIVAFGRGYLLNIKSKEEMIKELEEGLKWAYDKEETFEKLRFVDPDWTEASKAEATLEEALDIMEATVKYYEDSGDCKYSGIDDMAELLKRAGRNND